MKLRPSEDACDRLDMMMNYEDNTRINFNRIIVVFSFLILMVFLAMLFIH